MDLNRFNLRPKRDHPTKENRSTCFMFWLGVAWRAGWSVGWLCMDETTGCCGCGIVLQFGVWPLSSHPNSNHEIENETFHCFDVSFLCGVLLHWKCWQHLLASLFGIGFECNGTPLSDIFLKLSSFIEDENKISEDERLLP